MLQHSVSRGMSAVALGLGLATAPTSIRAQGAVDIPAIKYERFTLPNGMVGILNENHSSPIVTVDIWYHVGSKNELPGRTGFAHLFEHMMFEGSQNVPPGQHRMIVQSSGGAMNGSTTEDRTNYYEILPSNQLETALWMESDRMAFLLPALTRERFETQSFNHRDRDLKSSD